MCILPVIIYVLDFDWLILIFLFFNIIPSKFNTLFQSLLQFLFKTHPKNTIGWGLQNRLPWRRLPHYSILISFPPATISGSEREKSQGSRSGEYGTWDTNSYRKSNNFFVVMWGIVLVDVAVFPSMRRRIGPIIHCSKRHTLWIPQRSPWPSQPKEPFSPSSEQIRMETSIVSIVPWFQGYSDGPMFHQRSHNPWRNPSDCD